MSSTQNELKRMNADFKETDMSSSDESEESDEESSDEGFFAKVQRWNKERKRKKMLKGKDTKRKRTVTSCLKDQHKLFLEYSVEEHILRDAYRTQYGKSMDGVMLTIHVNETIKALQKERTRENRIGGGPLHKIFKKITANLEWLDKNKDSPCLEKGSGKGSFVNECGTTEDYTRRAEKLVEKWSMTSLKSEIDKFEKSKELEEADKNKLKMYKNRLKEIESAIKKNDEYQSRVAARRSRNSWSKRRKLEQPPLPPLKF
tara:strand:- start:925 stop:1701 length:777 start_codon:yes stop_codon:yes gene_type:complete